MKTWRHLSSLGAKKTLCNQHGDALPIALMVLAVSLISSLVIMSYSRQSEHSTRAPRVKSMMTSLEGKIRAALMTPSTYTCAISGDSTGGRPTCDLRTNLITGMSQVVSGAKCPVGRVNCGLAVTVPVFNRVAGDKTEVQVKIQYEGSDISLKDIDFTVYVPADVLQSSNVYMCPPTKPKFLGFNNLGQMQCEALSALASDGSMLLAIDQNTLATTTQILPGMQTCSEEQFVGSVAWKNGGSVLEVGCTDRQDPFQVFNFSPGTGVGGAIIYTPNMD